MDGYVFFVCKEEDAPAIHLESRLLYVDNCAIGG